VTCEAGSNARRQPRRREAGEVRPGNLEFAVRSHSLTFAGSSGGAMSKIKGAES
jgi:hypothetical protein